MTFCLHLYLINIILLPLPNTTFPLAFPKSKLEKMIEQHEDEQDRITSIQNEHAKNTNMLTDIVHYFQR